MIPIDEHIREHYRAMNRLSWNSPKTDKSKERFQKMQALSVLSRKAKKLSTSYPQTGI